MVTFIGYLFVMTAMSMMCGVFCRVRAGRRQTEKLRPERDSGGAARETTFLA